KLKIMMAILVLKSMLNMTKRLIILTKILCLAKLNLINTMNLNKRERPSTNGTMNISGTMLRNMISTNEQKATLNGNTVVLKTTLNGRKIGRASCREREEIEEGEVELRKENSA